MQNSVVQLRKGYRIFLFLYALIAIPLGIISMFAVFILIYDEPLDISVVIPFLVLIIAGILAIVIQVQMNKKIFLKRDGIYISAFFVKKIFYGIQTISKVNIRIVENIQRIYIYNSSNKKIVSITSTQYNGYNELKKWILINNIPIEEMTNK